MSPGESSVSDLQSYHRIQESDFENS
jgi:hypothetical protein